MTAPSYEPKNPAFAERVRSSFERQPFMAGVETLCATAQQTLMILADTPDAPR